MNLENPQGLQLVADCLKEEYGFTYRIIHNVCDGTQSIVPHGSIDLIGIWGVILFLSLIASVFIGILVIIILDI